MLKQCRLFTNIPPHGTWNANTSEVVLIKHRQVCAATTPFSARKTGQLADKRKTRESDLLPLCLFASSVLSRRSRLPNPLRVIFSSNQVRGCDFNLPLGITAHNSPFEYKNSRLAFVPEFGSISVLFPNLHFDRVFFTVTAIMRSEHLHLQKFPSYQIAEK